MKPKLAGSTTILIEVGCTLKGDTMVIYKIHNLQTELKEKHDLMIKIKYKHDFYA